MILKLWGSIFISTERIKEKNKGRYRSGLALIAIAMGLSLLIPSSAPIQAAQLKAMNEKRQTAAMVIIDDAYLEHDMLPNGDLIVNDRMELEINADVNSLSFYFAYSKPVELEIESLTVSVDAGEGFSIPTSVHTKSTLATDAANSQVAAATAYYQLVRSSDLETMHLVHSFSKGSRVRVNINYHLKRAVDRYTDLALLRRSLLSSEQNYPLRHLEAVYRFPETNNAEAIDFSLYTLYRWQNPVKHSYLSQNNEIRLEITEASAGHQFEFVIAYPAELYPDVPLSEDRLIAASLDKMLADIRQNEEVVGRLSTWLIRYLAHVIILLFALAILIIVSMHIVDVYIGRKNRAGKFYPHPPRGISASGLNFLLRRKVIGQDIYAVMIKLSSLGLIHYDKNLFTLIDEDDKEDRPSAQFDEKRGLWMVFGQKGAVYLRREEYIVYQGILEIAADMDGFSPAGLQKMSKSSEFSSLYYRVITDYAKAIKDDLQVRGLFDKHMKRGLFLMILILLYVSVAVLIFSLTLHWAAWLILVPAFAMTLFALNIRSLSREGHWTLYHTNQFRYYLTHFSQLPVTKQPADDVLIDLLIYAIAFGCESDYIDELYKVKTNEELIQISFYRNSGLSDLLRSSLVPVEAGRQMNLANRIKQRYREGRIDMIAVVFNSKHFYKL